MDWSDEGIVLSQRPHGETSAIVEIFTRERGRHMGLVKGGRSRARRPILQVGNHVDVTWRARLEDHLGQFTVELRHGYAAEVMTDRMALAGLSSLCDMGRLLAERDPHANLYEISLFVLSFMGDDDVWPSLLARWELALLDELGFGLDLTSCAATETTDDLIYVSPKSGRAVSREAGAPYKDKLLPLPAFLREGRQGDPQPDDVVNGLTLLGYFFNKHIYGPREIAMPEVRTRLIGYLKKRKLA